MRIWKVTLELVEQQSLDLPKGAKPLAVQVQHDKPCIWFEVNEREDLRETRTFFTYGTGNPMPDRPGTYLGTYQIMQGQLVLHVYEVAVCDSPAPT